MPLPSLNFVLRAYILPRTESSTNENALEISCWCIITKDRTVRRPSTEDEALDALSNTGSDSILASPNPVVLYTRNNLIRNLYLRFSGVTTWEARTSEFCKSKQRQHPASL
ncbi:hypothetical protein SLEP1_g37562 [Rubroshorea leprosula]|uniref:Uncharacterized protein n=1 Tax=Rubroshorea leprosula TaxID=152421 RepID=A0AAV5KV32_9ROSI|nr:hypothetical protein SLEP1_g37562 [Rubroshorea leprosula]